MDDSKLLSIDDVIAPMYTDRIWSAPTKYISGDLPRIYTENDMYSGPKLLENYNPFSLEFGLYILLEDFNIRGRNEIVVETKVGENQIITVRQGGEPIPDDKIVFVNETVEMILAGQELSKNDKRFYPSSVNIAARCFRRYAGELAYENLDNPSFSVETTMKFPLSKVIRE